VSEPDQAADAADAAQRADDTTTSPPPWGDDFNAERAWQTITHLRGREKELESDARAFKRLQEDEDAFAEYLAARGYELGDSDDGADDGIEEEYEDDDPRWARLEKAEQKLAEIEQQRDAADKAAEWNGWESYVKDLASKEGVELTGRDLKALKLDSAGKDGRPVEPGKAAKALAEHLEDLRAYEQQVIERSRKQRKRPPQSPGGGSTATQTPDLDTHQARVAHMVQQYADQNAD
jgi:hypothetical protein